MDSLNVVKSVKRNKDSERGVDLVEYSLLKSQRNCIF